MKHLDDALYAMGAVLIGTGLWLIYPPACFVFAGLVFTCIAYLLGVHQRNTPPEEAS